MNFLKGLFRKRNTDLAWKVLRKVQANEKYWDQDLWHRGVTHCFAGFVELEVRSLPPNTPAAMTLSGDWTNIEKVFTYHGFSRTKGDFPPPPTKEFAMQALRIKKKQADKLFSTANSLEKLEVLVEEIFGKEQKSST